MGSVRWGWILSILLTLITIGEARPKKPWYVRVLKVDRGRAHGHGHRQENNFYPDTEYFEREDSISDTESDSSDYIDYSGYGSGSDDEDASPDNRIGQIGQGEQDASWHSEPSSTWTDSQRPPQFPYLYELDQGDFGNELHEIDKIDELKERMAEMQLQLQEMQKLLRRQRRNKRGHHKG